MLDGVRADVEIAQDIFLDGRCVDAAIAVRCGCRRKGGVAMMLIFRPLCYLSRGLSSLFPASISMPRRFASTSVLAQLRTSSCTALSSSSASWLVA